MKIRRTQLKQIIKEEVGRVLRESPWAREHYEEGGPGFMGSAATMMAGASPGDDDEGALRHWASREMELYNQFVADLSDEHAGNVPHPYHSPDEWQDFREMVLGLEPAGPVLGSQRQHRPTSQPIESAASGGSAVGRTADRMIRSGVFDVEDYTRTPGPERDW